MDKTGCDQILRDRQEIRHGVGHYGLKDYVSYVHVFRLSDCQTVRLSDCQTVRLRVGVISNFCHHLDLDSFLDGLGPRPRTAKASQVRGLVAICGWITYLDSLAHRRPVVLSM
jgi:hypothetical protein